MWSLVSFRRLVVVAMLAMVAFGSAIILGVNHAVERAVAVDAEHKSKGWAAYFIERMPELDALFKTGRLTQAQLDTARTAEKLGDVFRFKLFDPQGGLVLVSDEAAYRTEVAAGREHSDKAAGVLATGISNVYLSDGTGKKNRPLLYVEAYVPIVDAAGSIKGVVEVYLDQTRTEALFKTAFASLAITLAIAAALAFGVPTLAFLVRNRQASEAQRRIEFLAHHDPMTSLLNRASFTDSLGAMIGAVRHEAMAVVFVDVDEFKSINDAHGHEGGDEFLKHVARCVTSICEKGDVVARLGGDEFTLALRGRGRLAATQAVERMLEAVRQPVAIRGGQICGRLSAGVHIVENAAESVADVMHKADTALCQAKIEGRNTYRVFSDALEASMRARRELEQRIREANESQTFELHYQPLLRGDTKQCSGFEALLRLPDGKGGLISPAAFIPVAESMGRISEIGAWVIDQATQTAALWPDHLFVSVNLSVKQFDDQLLVSHVRSALARSGLRPGQLELEITESLLMENTENVARQLGELRALGVSIAMDDFGTGYSSLGYLWQYGFDKLKIDRSFVKGLDAGDRKARDILDTIIMLGHKLDMTVTAEGIETEAQAEILASLACDHFQGYFYGRPLPLGDIAPFLLNNMRARLPGAGLTSEASRLARAGA